MSMPLNASSVGDAASSATGILSAGRLAVVEKLVAEKS
jgi:hypothetical protein